jgi:hypothetical protein
MGYTTNSRGIGERGGARDLALALIRGQEVTGSARDGEE